MDEPKPLDYRDPQTPEAHPDNPPMTGLGAAMGAVALLVFRPILLFFGLIILGIVVLLFLSIH